MSTEPQSRTARIEGRRENRGKPGGFAARKAKTIAYFSSSPGGVYNFEKWLMWRGIAEAARESGVNLVYVAGEEADTDPQSVLYSLIGKHNVDGLIVWNAFVNLHGDAARAQAFIDRFQPLPLVSIELPLKRCSNLLVDDARGVRDLLTHLVERHGYRRIAFVGVENNYLTATRQAAFEKTMKQLGLLDPTLVGTLSDLETAGVRWGEDCEAILAASDDLAVEIIETLRYQGLRVPEDVVVTGFNDGLEARGSLPPLTTVRMPFRSLGRKALEVLVKRLNGQDTPGDVYLSPYLITRRSCGCLEPLAEGAAVGPVTRVNGNLKEIFSDGRKTLPARIAFGMGTSVETLATTWAVQLVDIVLSELERCLDEEQNAESCGTPSRAYLRALSNLLREAVAEGGNVTRWHEALTILRQSLLPYLEGDLLAYAEDMWNQARVLLGQVAVRHEVHRGWQTARRLETLREIEADLLVASDFHAMLDILASGLPRLGMRDFALVLYENQFDPQGWARLALALQDGERVAFDASSDRFAVKDLLPEGLFGDAQPKSLVVEALQLRDEPIGYIVFHSAPPADASECDLYQALRIQLSSALKGVRLRQKLEDARQQAEEANHLKSRFLSMVSHELRTPLNLIVGLSEMAMRQQDRARETERGPGDVGGVLRKFLEQIYVSGQHLDRLIRDVLDLASSQVGQMSLICQPLDLLPVLQDVASMGEHLTQQKNLNFRFEVAGPLPQVNGDKTRLRQVILNLLSNAVKFTAHGEVALTAVVEGDEILISVADTGLGIAREDQVKIFDEFRQSDRSVARGYGGIGLGLAITRRLVEMHGGRIWVTSDGSEGSGSTFSLTLPVMGTVPARPAEAEAIRSHSIRNREGLVVIITAASGDGEPLSAHLSQHGFQVEEVSLHNQPEALDDLFASPPGAVVLDMAPASELGWDIMKRVKENPATQDVPVLFYSLLPQTKPGEPQISEPQQEAAPAGTVLEMDYLTKPVGTEDLVKALKRHGLGKLPLSGKRQTVLVIDDEPGIVELHTRIIRAEIPHVNVLTASNGQEGLHVMRHAVPDLVLLDLMMPELDGFGVLKAMQEEEMLRNVPVIVLSGQVLTRPEMERLNHGVAAVLSKGMFSAKEILTKVEDALARSKRLGSESQRLVQHAMAFIHERYKDPLSRADIANHLCINEQYLSRCFNKEMGLGPMVYLSRYRIQRAKRLLEQGNLSITQVAMEVGMSSQSYFSRVFQEETGVTPSAYQRGIRPEQD